MNPAIIYESGERGSGGRQVESMCSFVKASPALGFYLEI